jgi:hypothetical protein
MGVVVMFPLWTVTRLGLGVVEGGGRPWNRVWIRTSRWLGRDERRTSLGRIGRATLTVSHTVWCHTTTTTRELSDENSKLRHLQRCMLTFAVVGVLLTLATNMALRHLLRRQVAR